MLMDKVVGNGDGTSQVEITDAADKYGPSKARMSCKADLLAADSSKANSFEVGTQ